MEFFLPLFMFLIVLSSFCRFSTDYLTRMAGIDFYPSGERETIMDFEPLGFHKDLNRDLTQDHVIPTKDEAIAQFFAFYSIPWIIKWEYEINEQVQECGDITVDGVSSLLNCIALEDLLLRHNGPGIPRNFILDASEKMPMLRKISLDMCDARDGDFGIPDLRIGDNNFTTSSWLMFSNLFHPSRVLVIPFSQNETSLEANSYVNRYFLSSVTLARCLSEARRQPVHKKSLVLVWNSNNVIRTVVKERL
ncbi:hypothetical protein Pint_35916 [Pistacia integerrima]|uniref:Uncharacterized protein n=1 Tax=Pistacia integerrima TaxID=434235 RepID=A0ACC0Y215_9ROSI|nr:hypothetical protein Pint_35916 [Pistacia integerrima]